MTTTNKETNMKLIITKHRKRIEEISKANASEAFDQRHEYKDAFASYWDNVVDSLYEEHLVGDDREGALDIAYNTFKTAWKLEGGN
jgi:hypothetical protein